MNNARVAGMIKHSILIFIMILTVSASANFPAFVQAQGGQWTKYSGNPILRPSNGTWDADYVILPTVLYNVSSNSYVMWYVGSSQRVSGIGYATSPDGYTWTKHDGPVLTPGPAGAWDSAYVSLGGVVRTAAGFNMWYVGGGLTTYQNGAIGLATSTDGIAWTKYSHNPVLAPNSMDLRQLETPFVTKVETALDNMWYAARGQSDPPSSSILRILYTQSFDGISWATPTVVLAPSSNATAWDSGSVFSPSVFYDGFMFGMWYSALGQGSLVPEIGYATSKDGRTWERSSTNPILGLGASGSWDSGGVENPRIIFSKNGFMLYYDGVEQNVGNSIGVALPPRGFEIPEFSASEFSYMLGVALLAVAIGTFANRKLNRRTRLSQVLNTT
jgi:predicted GH43/DUF377 family glycosyl hydrolase